MKHHPANERIKREYFSYLKEARGRDEATIDGVAKALARFEASTGRKDFKKLHREQAKAFKRQLGEQHNARTGERLSKATMHSTLRYCRDFFMWLLPQPRDANMIAPANFHRGAKCAAAADRRRYQVLDAGLRIHGVARADDRDHSILASVQISFLFS